MKAGPGPGPATPLARSRGSRLGPAPGGPWPGLGISGALPVAREYLVLVLSSSAWKSWITCSYSSSWAISSSSNASSREQALRLLSWSPCSSSSSRSCSSCSPSPSPGTAACPPALPCAPSSAGLSSSLARPSSSSPPASTSRPLSAAAHSSCMREKGGASGRACGRPQGSTGGKEHSGCCTTHPPAQMREPRSQGLQATSTPGRGAGAALRPHLRPSREAGPRPGEGRWSGLRRGAPRCSPSPPRRCATQICPPGRRTAASPCQDPQTAAGSRHLEGRRDQPQTRPPALWPLQPRSLHSAPSLPGACGPRPPVSPPPCLGGFLWRCPGHSAVFQSPPPSSCVLPP